MRKRLPTNRPSITRKHVACGFTMYVTVSFYDGPGVTAEEATAPGEIFVRLAKRGSEISGLVDGIAVQASLSLQHGVPWPTIREKWRGTRFGQEDAEATSLLDALAEAVDVCIAERKSILGV